MKKYQQIIEILINIVAPITFGTMIYVLCRDFFFKRLKIYNFLHIDISEMPKWIVYNLPDGLWFYALLSTINIIWKENTSKYFVKWLLLAIVLHQFINSLSERFCFIILTVLCTH